MNYEPINEIDQDLKQPATKGDLKELRHDLATKITGSRNNTQRLIKGLEGKLEKWKDEILTSNDKVAKDYKTFETEKAAINQNYTTLDGQVQKLKRFAKKAGQKLGVEFEKV